MADAALFKPVQPFTRIFRGDTVTGPDGRREVVQQILAGGAIRTSPVVETRSWIELGAQAGAKSMGKQGVMKLRIEK